MKFSLKYILIVWFVLFLIVGGLFYSAYSRLKPETFVTLIEEQIEKNYPGASLSVGQVDYSMAVDFSLRLRNLTLTRSGKLLGSIGDLEMKIPWWLLILNRGSAVINLSNLEIYVDHTEESVPDPVKEIEKKNSRTIRVVLPGYLADARYTIKAKNISVKDSHNARRYFRLSKLLVREFQYGKNSAFELNIPIEISHRGTQLIAELWLFGDLTPEKNLWRLNYRGEFRSRESHDRLQMEDLIIDGKASLNPSHMNVDSSLELLVEKESVGEGSFSANDSHFLIDLKLNKFPMSFLEIIKDEVKNPFLTEISGTSTGAIKISKNANQELAQIKGHLGFDGAISLGDTVVNGKWKLLVDGPKWETSFISPKGEVSFFRRSLVDFSKGVITQYNEEIGFSGMDFRIASYPFLTLGHLFNDPSIVHYNTSISLKKCIWDKKTVDGEVKFGISPDQRFYVTNLHGDGLSLVLNYQEKSTFHQISLEAHNFPMVDQFKMFDPYLTVHSAILSGKLEGKWEKSWQDGIWNSTLSLSNLEKPKGDLPELINLLAKEFNVDSSIATSQSWTATHKNQVLNLTSIFFDSTDPAKITGNLSYNPRNKSFLVLSYPKNKTWKPVRKELAQPLWPLKDEP